MALTQFFHNQLPIKREGPSVPILQIQAKATPCGQSFASSLDLQQDVWNVETDNDRTDNDYGRSRNELKKRPREKFWN